MRQGKARLRLDGADPINSALLGFWPQSEAAGNRFYDLSPLRANGIINSGITRGFGLVGRCATYSTGNAQVTRPYTISRDVSIHGWICLAAGAGTSNVLVASIPVSDGNARYLLQCNSGTTLVMEASNNAGATVTSSAFTDIRSRWAAVGGTYNYASRDIKLYLGGVVVGAGNVSSWFPEATLSGYWIGRNSSGSRLFNGKMAGLRVWNRTLAPHEFQRLAMDPWVGTQRAVRRVHYVAPSTSDVRGMAVPAGFGYPQVISSGPPSAAISGA